MTLPFLITCKQPSVRLYELNDGRFQLIEPGPIAPFMCGYRYLLVEHQFASFLAELGIERIRQEPAILFNRGTGDELRSHVRIHVGQIFQRRQLQDLPLDGLRLLTMDDEYYFASPELKERLEVSPYQYLQFSEGLVEFAGNGH